MPPQPIRPEIEESLQPFSPSALQPFLRALLDEQQRLQTPVASFARAHDRLSPSALQSFSPSLIPLTAPKPGEQYAFQVDLDACTGCKACVAACHSLNGLDETEAWRDVGLLLGSAPNAADRTTLQSFSPSAFQPFSQTVTSACHHCADPGCLNGCPVRAYEKDPVTGIVRHLDDQCIGCSYCILKCPYDVPKYNDRLGIVRKCDLCHGRLAGGEAPACVQACPTHAISIVNVPVAPGPKADTSFFLPGAPDPAHTQPTTRYVSRRPLPAGLVPADAAALHVQPAHGPLVLMLVGTQASVGALAAGAGIFAALAAALGLGASVLHLGRPLRAWRAFLGLRRSWLSREIVVFGLYPPLLAATFLPALAAFARPAALFVGLVGVACSVMIYADTPRREWRLARTALHFVGTVTLLALATAFATAKGHPPTLAAALMGATLAKLAVESALARNHRQHRLRAGPLRRASRSRLLLAALGGVLLPAAALLDPAGAAGHAALALVALLAGELCERLLFFRSVDPSKMPGVASS